MNALTAPRAHLSLAGNQDKLAPVAGLVKVDTELKKVYASAGHPENWKLLRYEGGHLENPEMREEIRRWFRDSGWIHPARLRRKVMRKEVSELKIEWKPCWPPLLS